jgi:hypothetical protein
MSCEPMHCLVGSTHVEVRHHEDFGKKVRVNYFDISRHLSFLQKKTGSDVRLRETASQTPIFCGWRGD